MTVWTDIETWRTVFLFLAALGQTCFVVLYMTFPWWASFFGRALFYKALILGIFLDAIWLSRTFGFNNVDELYVVLYGLLTLGIWWQFLAFIRTKRRGITAGEDQHDRAHS